MRRALALWIHRNLPLPGLPNRRLLRWAWMQAADPEAPASVQRWWEVEKTEGGKDGQRQYKTPPRIRARMRR